MTPTIQTNDTNMHQRLRAAWEKDEDNDRSGDDRPAKNTVRFDDVEGDEGAVSSGAQGTSSTTEEPVVYIWVVT